MYLFYNLLIFVLTFIGGSLPIWLKRIDEDRMHYLLAFSGSFLLSITFLHLLPESYTDLGNKAGFYLLAGFFLQLIIQRLTHGIEHGRIHTVQDEHKHYHVPLTSMLAGLVLHAFMEGLPLGLLYNETAIAPSLYFAVTAHKLPEAILVTSLVLHSKGKSRAIIFLLLFSFITPLASFVAHGLNNSYAQVSSSVKIILPLVAGAFTHIATTIFFESGTKQHKLSLPKIFAIIAGLAFGLLTLLFK